MQVKQFEFLILLFISYYLFLNCSMNYAQDKNSTVRVIVLFQFRRLKSAMFINMFTNISNMNHFMDYFINPVPLKINIGSFYKISLLVQLK